VNKVNILLVVALLASCLGLVRVAYESRRAFAELDKARNEQRQLDAEYKRLDAERQAQATNLRVEKVARERLKMSTATPAVTTYVEDSVAATAPRAVAPSGATP
jgi:cell division protein FtsL